MFYIIEYDKNTFFESGHSRKLSYNDLVNKIRIDRNVIEYRNYRVIRINEYVNEDEYIMYSTRTGYSVKNIKFFGKLIKDVEFTKSFDKLVNQEIDWE
jgi:hypothetical protein